MSRVVDVRFKRISNWRSFMKNKALVVDGARDPRSWWWQRSAALWHKIRHPGHLAG